MRSCYACGSTETYIRSDNGLPRWRPNNDYDNMLCSKCFEKYIHGPIIHKKRNPRRITFNGKRVQVEENPRIGVCNWCRAVVGCDCQRTHMHHDDDRYDEDNPSRFTIEICVSCHNMAR